MHTDHSTADVSRIERPLSLVAQVEKTLRSAISESAFPGGRLPTAVELAEQFGVSRETVRLALETLQRDGLLTKRRRRGTFINPPSVPAKLTVTAPTTFGYLQADYGNEQSDAEVVTRSFSSIMLEGALVEAGRNGHSLIVRSARPAQLREAFEQLRAVSQLSGIIFASIAEEKFLKRLSGLSIPAVLLDHDLNLPKVSSIRGDSMQNAQLAVQHLAELGHRRIACAQWQQADLNPWFSRGYREAMRQASLRRRQIWELSVKLNSTGAVEAVDQLMGMSPRPTAILCFNNTFASYLIAAAEQRGLVVPDDLSVIGAGGERVVGLTCNQLDWYTLGRNAARILQRSIVAGEEYHPEHCLIQYELELGGTTAPPRRSNASCSARKAK
jgi:DNA-binding LacI/PurR family transcriptional regulator/DNA-binding transcriptional ArsR family regulator